MKLIHRKFNCVGITLFRLGNRQLELWFCPPKTVIPAHKHINIHSLFIHIYGRAAIDRNGENKIINKFSWFECHYIEPSTFHGAAIDRDNWFIFLNYERWHPAVKPSSAAEDIAYER